MPLDLIPRPFFGSRLPSLFEESDDFLVPYSTASGLQVSEDAQNIYVEAPIPGVNPDKIEMTFDKGVLWIRGQQEQEEADKEKKYYRRAENSFSYRVAVPGNIDENKEPEASYKNGVIKVTFTKVPEAQPKKISIKKS